MSYIMFILFSEFGESLSKEVEAWRSGKYRYLGKAAMPCCRG